MELKTKSSLAPTPRNVPVALRALLLFGGVGQFGWLLGGFGLIFVWVALPMVDWSPVTFRGPRAEGMATITAIEKTDSAEGKQPVFAVRYDYTVADGVKRSGVSYRTGKVGRSVGDRLAVEYLVADPSQARLVGMRRNRAPIYVSIVTLFPLVGAALVVGRFVQGRRRIDLLRNGEPAIATIRDCSPTRTRVNKRRVYKVVAEYVAADGLPRTYATRSTAAADIEGGEFGTLLYDPVRPERALLLRLLPEAAQPSEQGEFLPPRWGATLAIVPLIVIGGHVAYLLMR